MEGFYTSSTHEGDDECMENVLLLVQNKKARDFGKFKLIWKVNLYETGRPYVLFKLYLLSAW
jgi:hypothetical protein